MDDQEIRAQSPPDSSADVYRCNYKGCRVDIPYQGRGRPPKYCPVHIQARRARNKQVERKRAKRESTVKWPAECCRDARLANPRVAGCDQHTKQWKPKLTTGFPAKRAWEYAEVAQEFSSDGTTKRNEVSFGVQTKERRLPSATFTTVEQAMRGQTAFKSYGSDREDAQEPDEYGEGATATAMREQEQARDGKPRNSITAGQSDERDAPEEIQRVRTPIDNICPTCKARPGDGCEGVFIKSGELHAARRKI
jgi:hypothetical protein